MKHTIILLFLLLTTISFAQIPTYVPSNGLVGWWPFNGNANDESGNGNNGTVNGATLTVDRFGVADKAYSFDGVDDYIQAPNYALSGSITFTCWVNMSSYNLNAMGANDFIFFSNHSGLNNSSRNFLAGYRNFGSEFGHSTYLFDNSANLFGYYPTNQQPSANVWHQFVSVFNNGQSIKMYLDGVEFYSNSNVPSINNLPSLPIFFGIGIPTQFNFLNGSLDDIGIWNRALTECEIKDLYHAQLGYSTVDAGADQTICRGDMVTLQGTGGSSLAWDNGVIDGVPFEPAQSGAYVLTGADSLGCIGTDTVQVVVLENASSTINQTAIDSYTLNGQTYTQSGTYTQVVPAANGCDSVITLNLELDFTGIQPHTNTSLQLYPNPVKDVMTLVGLKGDAVSFAVYSVDGKLIKSGQTSGEIQLEDLKKGNYILKIENQALPFVKL